MTGENTERRSTGDALPGQELAELERLLVNLRPLTGECRLCMTPAFRDALVRLVRAARLRVSS